MERGESQLTGGSGLTGNRDKHPLLGVAVHTFDPSPWEAGQPGYSQSSTVGPCLKTIAPK